jgi:hypothetical protein
MADTKLNTFIGQQRNHIGILYKLNLNFKGFIW